MSIIQTISAADNWDSGCGDLRFEREQKPASIEDEWRTLQRSTGTAFQTFDWFQAWCDTAGRASGQEPAVIVCRDHDGALRAIFPLVRATEPFKRIITTPGQLHAAYHRTLVVPGRHAPCFFGRGGDGAWHLFDDADYFSVDGCSPDMCDEGGAVSGLANAPVGYSTHVMQLNGDWQALYNAKFNARSRSAHRRTGANSKGWKNSAASPSQFPTP